MIPALSINGRGVFGGLLDERSCRLYRLGGCLFSNRFHRLQRRLLQLGLGIFLRLGNDGLDGILRDRIFVDQRICRLVGRCRIVFDEKLLGDRQRAQRVGWLFFVLVVDFLFVPIGLVFCFLWLYLDDWFGRDDFHHRHLKKLIDEALCRCVNAIVPSGRSLLIVGCLESVGIEFRFHP